ncbi:MAG: Holliday junction resolvase RuvX [Vicinamibacterales bacterium]
MRVVAFDVGTRRTGIAVSDVTGTLARPWRTIEGPNVASALSLIQELRADPDGLGCIVVGLPLRLDGSPTQATEAAKAFAAAIEGLGLPVHLQDERLTSHEADARLAVGERDWRKRKARLDAVSAAVILQDFLDQHARSRVLE